jgi:hypothetical protein
MRVLLQADRPWHVAIGLGSGLMMTRIPRTSIDGAAAIRAALTAGEREVAA